jgi:1-acyl-sn-glycerol-3-phosphate acyltransferase
MRLDRWFVTFVCKFGLEILCRIRKENWERIPDRGPLIAYSNHTGRLEVPLMYTQMLPRPAIGFAKIEVWDNKFMGWVFSLWNVIPLRRGEADMEALHKAIAVVNQGMIFGISPEGTRSKTGALIRAHGGTALLALHTGAPLIPIAHWGGENFTHNLKRFRRTDFYIRVGNMFRLDAHGEKVTKEIRQQMADEMMYELAKLLPPEYRGEYADLENATTKYLKFE